MNGRFTYYQCAFSVQAGAKLTLSITAGSRYRLRVNEKPVLSGPCKGDPYRGASQLPFAGENVLAVTTASFFRFHYNPLQRANQHLFREAQEILMRLVLSFLAVLLAVWVFIQSFLRKARFTGEPPVTIRDETDLPFGAETHSVTILSMKLLHNVVCAAALKSKRLPRIFELPCWQRLEEPGGFSRQ